MGTSGTGGAGTKKALGSLTLQFNKDRDNEAGSAELSAKSLSAIVSLGDSLYAGGDEGLVLVRLEVEKEGAGFVEKEAIDLRDWFDVPTTKPAEPNKPVSEIDLEGLAVGDTSTGRWLWLVGSHSVKRGNPDRDDSDEKNLKKLHKVGLDPNRLLLGRLPVAKKGDQWLLDDTRKAAQLDPTITGNPLLAALRKDPLLKAFVPDPKDFAPTDMEKDKENKEEKNGKSHGVAGKENGLDIEGLAVVGDDRVLIGLRGPVLRGMAVLLEVQLQPAGSGGRSDRLDLAPIGPDRKDKDGGSERALYRRHFVDLAGNGVRDLCWDGKHLLILAGPTMSLDAPPCVFRWINAAEAMNEAPGADEHIRWRRMPNEKEDGVVVPSPERYFSSWVQPATGKDHAESIDFRDGGGRELLIAYDSPAKERMENKAAVCIDVVRLDPPS